MGVIVLIFSKDLYDGMFFFVGGGSEVDGDSSFKGLWG